jgi:hypothetical protein
MLLGALLLGVAIPAGKSAVQTPAAVPAPAARPAPAHEDSEFVNLVIRVVPPSAQVTIDGAAAGNPFHARYPKDSQIHHVMASADGYDTKLEDVSFANDVSVDISLNRHPNTPARQGAPAGQTRQVKRSAAAAAPAGGSSPDVPGGVSPTPPRPDVSPVGGRAPLRPIATSNPYGNP